MDIEMKKEYVYLLFTISIDSCNPDDQMDYRFVVKYDKNKLPGGIDFYREKKARIDHFVFFEKYIPAFLREFPISCAEVDIIDFVFNE